jgi:hypothetical protein
LVSGVRLDVHVATVDDGRNHVGQLCSSNSRLILAVSCGFAGPLLSLMDGESGESTLLGRHPPARAPRLWWAAPY